MQRIAAAIQSIKVDFAKPLRVADLAEQASMSPSSFHHHFKQVTSIQYSGQFFEQLHKALRACDLGAEPFFQS